LVIWIQLLAVKVGNLVEGCAKDIPLGEALRLEGFKVGRLGMFDLLQARFKKYQFETYGRGKKELIQK